MSKEKWITDFLLQKSLIPVTSFQLKVDQFESNFSECEFTSTIL